MAGVSRLEITETAEALKQILARQKTATGKERVRNRIIIGAKKVSGKTPDDTIVGAKSTRPKIAARTRIQ